MADKVWQRGNYSYRCFTQIEEEMRKMKYEKPMMMLNDSQAENVYLASGMVAEVETTTVAPIIEEPTTVYTGPKCDSIYMKGEWQKATYDWSNGNPGYKKNYGCMGCPAYTETACGLKTHYVNSGNASSYDVDNGTRKPTWEKEGHGPMDPVTF